MVWNSCTVKQSSFKIINLIQHGLLNQMTINLYAYLPFQSVSQLSQTSSCSSCNSDEGPTLAGLFSLYTGL